MRTISLGLAMSIALLLGAVGCRSLEGASQDVTNGFRGTQQDLQHGVRGDPDPNDPSSPAASGASATSGAPSTATPPKPAPTSSGVNL